MAAGKRGEEDSEGPMPWPRPAPSLLQVSKAVEPCRQGHDPYSNGGWLCHS